MVNRLGGENRKRLIRLAKSPTTAEVGNKLPPIHPGKILLEDMKEEDTSINGLAQPIRVPANYMLAE